MLCDSMSTLKKIKTTAVIEKGKWRLLNMYVSNTIIYPSLIYKLHTSLPTTEKATQSLQKRMCKNFFRGLKPHSCVSYRTF